MICKRCGEEWDLDSIHEAVKEEHPDLRATLVKYGRPPKDYAPYDYVKYPDDCYFDQRVYERDYFKPMVAKFRREGCEALDPGARRTYCAPERLGPEAQEVVQEIFDTFGDDVDGMESGFEDAREMGLI